MSKTFKAFFLNKVDDEINHNIKEINFSDLMPGNVLVKLNIVALILRWFSYYWYFTYNKKISNDSWC